MSDQAIAPVWPLETERLVLRPFGEDDLDALFAIHSDAEIARYLYNEPRSREEVRALLSRKIDGATVSSEGDWLSAAVVVRQSGELIGDCSLQWVSKAHRQGEIGFVFNRAYQGRGFATEAARAVLAVAFDDLGLHRVVGRLEARNTASARVLERLGMRREAHLIENEFVKGEWQSELVYALLQSGWRARR
ncbi:MAG: GNAT family N-acetyltransferase [Gaiellaceae bacterium MAG52_C11]|nr:GNAT family N-acetyltransferase [Candidatus Gaiellasilicea maunaloa]